MNCRETTEILDRMLFEEVAMDAGLLQHIDNCVTCSQVYREVLKARELLDLVRRSEPLLRNPEELTDNIMAGLVNRPKKISVVPLLLRRFLAAASVAMFLMFGYEQYLVVKKVSALEIRFNGITTDPGYSGSRRLASAVFINNAGLSLADIERRLTTGKGATLLSFSLVKKQLALRNIK